MANAIEYRFTYSSIVNNLARYESRLERSFYKALHAFERLRRGATSSATLRLLTGKNGPLMIT